MKVVSIQLTLSDLQEALLDFAHKKGAEQPELVIIMSYDKVMMTVEMIPDGIVESRSFRHRARPE